MILNLDSRVIRGESVATLTPITRFEPRFVAGGLLTPTRSVLVGLQTLIRDSEALRQAAKAANKVIDRHRFSAFGNVSVAQRSPHEGTLRRNPTT